MTFCDPLSIHSAATRLCVCALLALIAPLAAVPALASDPTSPSIMHERGDDPIVPDSSFEAGTPNPVWTEFSTVGDTPICSGATCGGVPNGAFDGEWWVWFGRSTSSEISTISQEITIPTTVNTLSFYLAIPIAEKPGAVQVQIDGTRVFQANENDAATYSEYQQVLVEVDGFADGGTHTLSFSGIIGAGDGTQLASLFVDLVTFTAEPREPSFVVDPLTLSFEVEQGDTSDSQTVTISNAGNATGTYEVTNIGDGDVLLEVEFVEDADGTVERDSTEQIAISAMAIPTADPGVYTTSITLLTDDPENPEVVVTAEVTVTPAVSNEGGTEQATFRFETYPNPFTDQATLRYNLPEAATVRVEVYDVAGRHVATLVDEPQAAGTHEVEWDAAELPSGVYVYRVEAGAFSETQQITLVR